MGELVSARALCVTQVPHCAQPNVGLSTQAIAAIPGKDNERLRETGNQPDPRNTTLQKAFF
jgi:hypothetical protein